MDDREFRERYQYDSKKDLLGVGGFGRVYRARDLLLNRQVALKVFSRDVPEQYDLISEIRRAIDLNHPNICRYYGAEVLHSTNPIGEAQVIQVGIMEYVAGGTIGDFLRRNPQHRKKLLGDVLHGLSYLHRHQPSIIHRDLKPSNVLVGFEDRVPVARITDFGISKSASLSGAGVSVVGLGTFAYMAPEQLNPARYGVNGKIQCNLDLWSFGVMTVELLTGTLPFGASNPEASTGEIFEAIARGLPAETLNRIEEPYQAVLKLCMVQDAGKRAQSAGELLSLLERAEEEPDALRDRRQTAREAPSKLPRPTRDTVAEELYRKTVVQKVNVRKKAEGHPSKLQDEVARAEKFARLIYVGTPILVVATLIVVFGVLKLDFFMGGAIAGGMALVYLWAFLVIEYVHSRNRRKSQGR